MRIFYITPRVPYPIDKGDKLRAYYQIKYLSQKHKIYLFACDENCNSQELYAPLKEFCEGITILPLNRIKIAANLINGITKDYPLQTSYYYSSEFQKILDEKIDEFKPDIIICQLIRGAEYVRNKKNIPRIIDYVDVISKGLERRITKSTLPLKLVLSLEHNRAIKYENKTHNDFDASLIITEEDRKLLPFDSRNVNVIANGIDMEYFHPFESDKKYDLFFSGNLSYPPNVDASIYIVNEILPIVKKSIPNLKVLIAGATPHKKVLALQSEHVEIKGWVDDIRDYYKEAKVFLAPLRIGTGLQNKILQAMAMKIPCITSELTKKGISEMEGDYLLVGKNAESYAELAIKLLKDKNYGEEIATNGYNFVKEYFNWHSIINKLESVILNVHSSASNGGEIKSKK